MGNYFYADRLIGMTIEEAEAFISNNTVYLNSCNTKYRILELRVLRPNGWHTLDYCLNRLQVRVEDDVVIKIEGCG